MKVLKIVVCLFLLNTPFMMAHEHGRFTDSKIMETMQPGDKAALLMVHFGTTHDDTREKTINVLNERMKEEFKEMTIFESYSSRIVVRRLKKRGIEKVLPLDALLKLRADGFTHVVIQTSYIIEGVEMETLRREVEIVRPFFKDIRVATPLLYTVEDAQAVTAALAEAFPKKEEVVFIGHGTYVPATATYALMDCMFNEEGLKRFHMATIEGYPSFETVAKKLKENKTKRVTLAPFMFVAGEHAKNDIAVDWKELFEARGLKVDVLIKGLGEYPAIQQVLVDHARFIMDHKFVDLRKKKAIYLQQED